MMIITALVIICICIFQLLTNLKHESIAERLPWILYLCSSFALVPSLFILLPTGEEISLFRFFLKIVTAGVIVCPIVTGMIVEAFKPSWKHVRFKWWLPILVILIIVSYCYLIYILNSDGFFYNDPPLMIIIGALFLLPFLASLFPLSKAPDKQNRNIYGFISGGFGIMTIGFIITLSFYTIANELLPLIFTSYIFMLVMISLAAYLKLEQTREQKER